MGSAQWEGKTIDSFLRASQGASFNDWEERSSSSDANACFDHQWTQFIYPSSASTQNVDFISHPCTPVGLVTQKHDHCRWTIAYLTLFYLVISQFYVCRIQRSRPAARGVYSPCPICVAGLLIRQRPGLVEI
jgi:hypothetical protein